MPTTAQLIAQAIDHAAQHGIGSLNEWQRTVFFISEAETLCDMGGSFADSYTAECLEQAFAAAFARIGAHHIAALFVQHARQPDNHAAEQQLAQAVSNRMGYDYERIAAYVRAAQQAG